MLLLVIGGGLAGLAALHHHGAHAQSTTGPLNFTGLAQNITDDAYFYGESPPVYPSPNGTGTGNWSESYTKAAALVSQMTLAEKVNLTGGISTNTLCSGSIPAIPRLGFPGLCLSDAGNGLRSTTFVSSWASGISVGASWNRDLTLARGQGMGGEWKAKGVNILLGPVVAPMGRTTEMGRTWEGISIDPYLAGALAYETVSGIQSSGVTTSTKHYIGYEQETNRNPEGNVSSVSSNIDDKTMHEIYLWPFQDAVLAGSGNIMCSYNRVNNSYACQNSKTLNGLLKTELGFQGFVVTDWGGQHGGAASALAGLDMAMPSGDGYWGSLLTEAVNNGSVPEYRITDMATRIIASWYQMGQDKGFPAPGAGMPPNLAAPYEVIDGRNPATKPTLLSGAIEGHVLVKNVNNSLPLKKPRMLSIFGYSARSPDQNDVGPNGSPWFGGDEPYTPASDLFGGGFGSDTIAAIAINGTMYSGGGSGATSQSLVSSPMDAITAQCWEDDTVMFWDFTNSDPVVPANSDACLVIVNAWASEGYDRPALRDDYTDALVKNVADNCANTIVIFHNAGVRLVDQWVDHPNVTGLIYAHLPGQYSGKALVSILYGTESPSGKLPYTVAKNESDYGDLLEPAQPEGIFGLYPQSNFSEGVFTDYRRFDKLNIEPRFEFGFGLSYTTFQYSNLWVSPTSGANTDVYPTGPVVEGGQKDLWDVLYTVTVVVRNGGSVTGAEVGQLYVSMPGAGSDHNPVKQLRGFYKQVLEPTQSTVFSFPLTRRDLSVWDTVAQKWQLQRGNYTVMVGGSSKNLPLTASFII